MADVFCGAKLKIERANRHIAELHSAFQNFFSTKPYKLLTDFDENIRKYGLRVEMTEALPPMTGVIIGDVVHNLRSSLEHVWSDLHAIALGESARERSKFPMHMTRENLVNEVCDGEIHTSFPEIAAAVIDTIKPYKGGQTLIWLTGKLWNIDKHRLPITTYGVTHVEGIDVRVDKTGSQYMGCSARVDQGRCVGLVATDAPMTVTNQGQATFYVQFDEPGLLEGDPVVPTLAQMSQLTSEAVDIIEQAYNASVA